MSSVTEVPRLRGVDRTEFLARFERPGTPVVLEGAVRESIAARTWSPATLRERLGDAPAEFKVSGSNAHPDFRQPNLRASFAREGASFAEFLDRIGSNALDARARYLFTGDEQFLWRRREKRTFVNEHYGVLLD
ncbi:MAG TPA: cupin-like domain-containing protein, partial [Polyangiaceae bacterium]